MIKKTSALTILLITKFLFMDNTHALTLGQVVVSTACGIQSNGQLVAAGNALSEGVSSIMITRYNTDGTLDTTYGTNGACVVSIPSATDSYASDIKVQTDDKVIVVGNCIINQVSSAVVVRIDTDGTLDATFGTNGIVVTTLANPSAAQSLVLQSTNIVVYGNYYSYPSQLLLYRLDNNGSLDTTFGTSGITTTFLAYVPAPGGICLQSTQDIVVSGTLQGNNFLNRYTSNGILDTTFGTDGTVITSLDGAANLRGICVDSSDNLFALGTYKSQAIVLKYDSAGVLDNTFAANGQLTFASGALTLLFDGVCVTGGNTFLSGSGGGFAMVSKILSNGTFDTTFGDNNSGMMRFIQGVDDSFGYGMVMQADGKILCAGALCHGCLAFRLNSDGSLDTTFNETGFINDPSGDPCKVTANFINS